MKKLINCALIMCVGYLPMNLKYQTFCNLNGESELCESIHDDVQFLHYTRSNQHEPHFLKPGDDRSLSYGEYNHKIRTVIFIHGLGESAYGEAATLIKEKLLRKGEFNVILVNWHNLAGILHYCGAIDNLSKVASYTTRLIIWLQTKKLISVAKLHIIGFSLGAHISGLTGAALSEFQSQKIGRITGLDPAGPIFEVMNCTQNTLAKSDATFVDIIHTDTDLLGLDWTMGHVDFYPNYGKHQPGCKSLLKDLCSHSRAWEYFAESITDPTGFRAAKCKKRESNLNKCNAKKYAIMGFSVFRKSRGIYMLKTNSEKPFARGSDGTYDDEM